MIALAHYFTSRRTVSLPPEVARKLAAEGHVEAESNPLYLPRHSIRAVLVLAFAWLAFYLYKEHRLFESQAVSVLGVIFAYFLGIVVRFKGVRGWEDLKAAVVLVFLSVTAATYLLNRPDLLPHQASDIALAMVLFYLGSR